MTPQNRHGLQEHGVPRTAHAGRLRTSPVCVGQSKVNHAGEPHAAFTPSNPQRTRVQECLQKNEQLKIILPQTLGLGYADTEGPSCST